MLERLGKYEIETMLGEGAMGVVYKAFDPNIERTVAVKTLNSSLLEGERSKEEGLARFQREARAAGRLAHPNVVAVYDYGEDNGLPYIVMEYIEGRDLKAYIKAHTRFEVNKIADIIGQLLDALNYTHSRGVIHRDLKPANIFLLDDGLVKIGDFGIARVESSNLTQTGAILGTPHYMSPEQFMAQRVDPRVDLFSTGVILYELLTGSKPFPGKTAATVMREILFSEAKSLASFHLDIPGSFNPLLERALAKEPSKRFQSAGEFKEALKLAAEDRYVDEKHDETAETKAGSGGPEDDTMVSLGSAQWETSTTKEPVASVSKPQTRPAQDRSKLAMIAVAAVLILSMGGIGWWLMPTAPEPERSAATRPPPQTAPPPAVDQPAAGMGAVHAVSQPSGAAIYLEDVMVGFTPFDIELPPGEYRVVLKKEGYQDMETRLDVNAAAGTDLDVTLNPR